MSQPATRHRRRRHSSRGLIDARMFDAYGVLPLNGAAVLRTPTLLSLLHADRNARSPQPPRLAAPAQPDKPGASARPQVPLYAPRRFCPTAEPVLLRQRRYSGLARQHCDRGHTFIAAYVTRPCVPDAAVEIERGLLGEHQGRPATRASGSPQVRIRWKLDRGLDVHRRISSTAGPQRVPQPASCMRSMARLRRHHESLIDSPISAMVPV
jgi:hypothetical protein